MTNVEPETPKVGRFDTEGDQIGHVERYEFPADIGLVRGGGEVLGECECAKDGGQRLGGLLGKGKERCSVADETRVMGGDLITVPLGEKSDSETFRLPPGQGVLQDFRLVVLAHARDDDDGIETSHGDRVERDRGPSASRELGLFEIGNDKGVDFDGDWVCE